VECGRKPVGLEHIALLAPLTGRETLLRPTGDPVNGGIPTADSSADDDGGITTEAPRGQLAGEAPDHLIRYVAGGNPMVR
jgi:hypothetical protein